MCDETDLENWARNGLTRRQIGALTAAGAAAACTPITVSRTPRVRAVPAGEGDQRGIRVSIPTPHGTMDADFIHPAIGRHAAVLFWPDIAAPRTAKRLMARRLASEGYAVLVVNPYYRDVPLPIVKDFADFAGNGGFDKVKPWREKLTPEAIMSDAQAAIGWLDSQAVVDNARGVGTQGYCMGGPFTVWTAAAVPDRVRAAASFHGGGLVRPDFAMSPHKLFARSQANHLIAIAQNDDAKAPGDKDALRAAADAAGRAVEIEVYPADHGWCVPDSPSYSEEQAERAWGRLLAHYRAALAS